MSNQEIIFQIAFAEKQFEIYKANVFLNHAAALTADDLKEKENYIQRMKNFIHLMSECNETLDDLRRKNVLKMINDCHKR